MSAKEREAADWDCVSEQEVHSFIERALQKVGAKAEHASIVADALLSADVRGVSTHGVNKLGKCLRR